MVFWCIGEGSPETLVMDWMSECVNEWKLDTFIFDKQDRMHNALYSFIQSLTHSLIWEGFRSGLTFTQMFLLAASLRKDNNKYYYQNDHEGEEIIEITGIFRLIEQFFH